MNKEQPMTKAALLNTLRARRAEWDAAVAAVPEAWMVESGVAGHWSVKDMVAHLAYYERWMADRLHEQLRGERYAPTALDLMHWEARNPLVYQQERDRPLAEVLAQSRAAFERLVAGVEAHSEAFLTEPQAFEGAPQPVIVWQMLRSEVYDHYAQHIPSIQHWLAARQGEQGS